jgi:acyl-CoA synthetase (AMP-forming)/AMP-acid ligase II
MSNPKLVHELVRNAARARADSEALAHKTRSLDYRALWARIERVSNGLLGCGLEAGDRIGVYLPKGVETVCALLATSAAGGVFVPLNPLLKPFQVAYILEDCNIRTLVTSAERAELLAAELVHCQDLRHLVIVDGDPAKVPAAIRPLCLGWDQLLDLGATPAQAHRRIDADMAAILYTSGSTGRPKGVVLSHRNMLAGAQSVAEYLENTPSDRILAVLPFSFDYGLSQMTTAFTVGACVVLMDYLLPGDVIRAVERHRITGLAAVPPLWIQLSKLQWPDSARDSLRYITSSGGAMPQPVTRALRDQLPGASVYLMYGLTEAFRSTYLPPQ